MRHATLLAAVGALTAMHALGQTATNNCGFTAGAQYPVGSSCSYTSFSKPGTFTNYMNPGTCNAGNRDDAWGWFQATATLTTVTYNPSGSVDPILHVFSGTCGALVQEACADDFGNGGNETVTFATTPGTNYAVRVQRYNSNTSMNGALCIYSTVPPVNDEPCGAIALSVGGTCSYTNTTNQNATESGVTAPPCGGFISGAADVWYSFVAPASGMVVLETSAGSLSDLGVALYEAPSCSGPFTRLGCDDDSGPGYMSFLTYNRLTPGDTYYVRAWGWGGGQGDFDICLRSPSLTGGDCTYVLELFDVGENGWGSSRVGISLNGAAFTYHTTTSRYDVTTIAVNTGDVLVVQYDNSGPDQDQNRYTIRQLPSGDGIHTGGPYPFNGIVFTETVDCIPPAPPQEDCRGAMTICGSQSFASGGQGVGYDSDLDAYSYGCLSASEREGLWYFFSPSTGGNVGFTITPNDLGDDYDFAIWGPLGSAECSPDSSPLRCSYAAPSGTTGLNYTATDASEGPSGDKWVDDIAVSAGEVYILYVSNWSQSGIAFALDWDLRNGASLDCTVLPIELLDFQAQARGEVVDLLWSTATETDNAWFEVQRSADGEHYQTIATVPGAGTSLERRDYVIQDIDPLQGVSYYRLEQVDHDGSSSYSPVRSVRLLGDHQNMLVYPNPAMDVLHIAMPHQGAVSVMAEVLDMSGRTVLQVTPGSGASDLELTVPVEALGPAPYFIRILDAQGRSIGQAPFIRR